MRAVYENILGRIEQRKYNVFRPRIRALTPVKRLWLAAQGLVGIVDEWRTKWRRGDGETGRH